MKKLIHHIAHFFTALFTSKKRKTQKTIAKGNKRLVEVLVKKEKSKSDMQAWLKKATNNYTRFNTNHQLNLLHKKFGQEISKLGIKATVKNNRVQLKNSRI